MTLVGKAKTYELKAPTVIEDVWLGERFHLEFTAGRHTPKSEMEEYALAHAVELQSLAEAQAAPVKTEETEA